MVTTQNLEIIKFTKGADGQFKEVFFKHNGRPYKRNIYRTEKKAMYRFRFGMSSVYYDSKRDVITRIGNLGR